MTTSVPTLLELQHAVRRDFLGLADGDASRYVVPDGLEPQAWLGIYRNTATGALLTALRLAYPAVQALVGPEFFEGAARQFIEHNPPASAQLDGYGGAFPNFLEQMPQAESLVYLPDAARLEWPVNEVLHAPDTNPLDLGRLRQLDEAELQQVCFLPNPAVRLLQSAYPVDAIWSAVLTRDDSALASINLAAGPVSLYVCRCTSGVDIKRIGAWQWSFTTALLEGRPLSDALVQAPPDEAPVWLASLLASGCFAGVRLSGQPYKPIV
ncbi:HvfC/BufC family peptide modification chaperone [Cupriavidus sp. TMH.W2]|uniref:HvfC/BufC family peptide modification chaperone n=1 Tax=Cupriavidus sp. TMH.W2 TaxID=3434465 RepID=UPI003D76C877